MFRKANTKTFLYITIIMIVVNNLLNKGISNPYLSRYSSVSLSYQCLNLDPILSAIDVNTDTITLSQ